MTYTQEQKNLISALIGTKVLPRTRSESLKSSLIAAHGHMYSDCLTSSDLLLINSALELVMPMTPEDENKEEYRSLIEALMATRGMLREVEQQLDIVALKDSDGCALYDGDVILVENDETKDYGVIDLSGDEPGIHWLNRPYLNRDLAFWRERAKVVRVDDRVQPYMRSEGFCDQADT